MYFNISEIFVSLEVASFMVNVVVDECSLSDYPSSTSDVVKDVHCLFYSR